MTVISNGGSLFRWALLLLLIILGMGASCTEEEEGASVRKVLREGPPPLKSPIYWPLGTYVVNMPGGKYYLKSSITLAFESDDPQNWMSERRPLIDDLVIQYLQNIAVAQFEDVHKRQFLKNDLLVRLNSLFPNSWGDPQAQWEEIKPVKRILFTEFYKQ